MSFIAAGTLDGALYEVEVTGKATLPVVGSKRVARLVEQWAGETIAVTPVGPSYVVAGDDPASVLALLSAKTRLRRVSDDAPALMDPVRPDAVM